MEGLAAAARGGVALSGRTSLFHFADNSAESLAVLLEAAVHVFPAGQRRWVVVAGQLDGSLVGHMATLLRQGALG